MILLRKIFLFIIIPFSFLFAQSNRIQLNEVTVRDKLLFNLIEQYKINKHKYTDTTRWKYEPFDTVSGVYLIKKYGNEHKDGFMISDTKMKTLDGLDNFKYSRYFYYNGALVLVNDNIASIYVKKCSIKKRFDFFYNKNIMNNKIRSKGGKVFYPIPDYIEPFVFIYKIVDNQLIENGIGRGNIH